MLVSSCRMCVFKLDLWVMEILWQMMYIGTGVSMSLCASITMIYGYRCLLCGLIYCRQDYLSTNYAGLERDWYRIIDGLGVIHSILNIICRICRNIIIRRLPAMARECLGSTNSRSCQCSFVKLIKE